MRNIWILILVLAVVLSLNGCGMQAGEHEYAECFAWDCEMLEQLSKEGSAGINEGWLNECLFHYHVQSDGHGLAFVLHPDGLDTSGTIPMVVYETSDGGKNWNVLHERFDADSGRRELVYMGKTVVLAANQAKGDRGTMVVSYDRGRTWTEKMYLDDLMDYDTSIYGGIEPYVINYNEQTGVITFGWKDYASPASEYLLINQFDANVCRFVEEVYRSPDFPRAS